MVRFNMGTRLWLWCVTLLCAVFLHAAPGHADYARFNAEALQKDPGAKLLLKGDWLFAWDQFLSPAEAVEAFSDATLPSLPIPAEWSSAVPADVENRYNHGKATYVAKLTLPAVPLSDITLNMGVVHDAYRIFWVPLDAPDAAREIAAEGNLSGPTLAANRYLNHPLPVSGDGLLVVHVRKTMFAWGGISHEPFVALKRTADLSNYQRLLLAGLMTGLLLQIILRNSMLYFSNLRDTAAGILSMITLLILIRVIAVENVVEIMFGAQWHGARMRVEVACVPLLATWTLRMFEELFPRALHPVFRMPVHLAAPLIAVTTFIVPLEMVPMVLTVAQIVALITFVPGLVRIADAFRDQNKEARLLGLTAGACLLAGINDISASISDSYNLYLIPISVVFLVMVLNHIVGNRAAVAIAHTDLLEQEKEQLAQDRNDAVFMARHDHLTGLLNRQSFDHHWAQSWLDSVENHQPLTVILFDIDHFKAINDTYGHPTGDQVLKELAKRLTQFNLRKTDRLCRYGGEEFALILPNCTQEDGFATAERLRKTIAHRPMIEIDPEISITCSFGIASKDTLPGRSAQDLLNAADEALYAAKSAGRDCVKSAAHLSASAA